MKNALNKVRNLASVPLNKSISTSPGAATTEAPNGPYRYVFGDVTANKLTYEPLEVPGQDPVPHLANKLDRVLFSPGVHFLKDPRTNVYNFDPKLEHIMSITDFNFDQIPPYVPAGRDSKLSELALENQRTYTGSTSSLTPVLTQFHHALSHQRPPQILNLDKHFPGNLTSFSVVQRAPTELWLKKSPKTGTYSVALGSNSSEVILTLLGQAMEVMLTTEASEFAKWSKHHPQNSEIETSQGSTYNYTTSGPFLMRSQLDCHDPRLPGSGMFDLKTRACCAVRHDMDFAQIKDGSDYSINKLTGQYESFSREFYELVRSAMFKYSLQARIGRMDGIFVAYHSIKRLFGFEYLPLTEIDKIYHTAQLVPEEPLKMVDHRRDEDVDTRMSNVATVIADQEFRLSVDLLSKLFDYLRENVPLMKGTDSPDIKMMIHCDGPGSLAVFAQRGNYQNEALEKPEPDAPKHMRGFRVHFRQSINNRFVPVTRYPSLHEDSDQWRVSASIMMMSKAELQTRYKETLSSMRKLELVTEPVTDKSLQPHEQAELLSKLPEATKFQEVLRKYDQKGSEYFKWDALREKIELRD